MRSWKYKKGKVSIRYSWASTQSTSPISETTTWPNAPDYRTAPRSWMWVSLLPSEAERLLTETGGLSASWVRNTWKGISRDFWKVRRTVRNIAKRIVRKASPIVLLIRRTLTRFWMRRHFLPTMRDGLIEDSWRNRFTNYLISMNNW
jgi:hypothetical protein